MALTAKRKAAINNWSKLVESVAPNLKSQSQGRFEWLCEYVQNHNNVNQKMALNEDFNPTFGTPQNGFNVNGMGAPTPAAAPHGPQTFYGGRLGSGDLWPNTLPIAIQVAARTVGFDIVNVIPMSAPTQQIMYLDFVYAGGTRENGADKPQVFSIDDRTLWTLSLKPNSFGATEYGNLSDANLQHAFGKYDTANTTWIFDQANTDEVFGYISLKGVLDNNKIGTKIWFVENGGNSVGGLTHTDGSRAMLVKFIGRDRITGDPIFQILDTIKLQNASGTWTNKGKVDLSMNEIFMAVKNGTFIAFLDSVADSIDRSTDGVLTVGNVYTSISENFGTSISTKYVNTFAGSDYAATPVATDGTAVPPRAQLVNALQNFIEGFAGAGINDADDWRANDPYNDSYGAMAREIGEQQNYRQLNVKMYSKNVAAETLNIAIPVTLEQIQDMRSMFNIDALALCESKLIDEVAQSINRHILSRAFALGWTNNYEIYRTQGVTLNMSLDLDYTSNSGAVKTRTYAGKLNTGVTIPIPYYRSYGNMENLTTLQRLICSQILAASNIIQNRSRFGGANFVVTNTSLATALIDQATYSIANMSNTLNQDSSNLYPIGQVAGMMVYVDPYLPFTDNRVLVGRKGEDDEPGIKLMPYIMAERVTIIAEGTMSPKLAIKSRYALVETGHHPETFYYTLYVDGGDKLNLARI